MAHTTSREELHSRLREAAIMVEIGARYAHYKNPQEHHYIVKDLAILEATEEPVVIYEGLYGQNPVPFIRPISDFLAIVEKDGQPIPRFQKV